MNNPAIKISDDAAVLHSIIEDEGRTAMACWTPSDMEEVQASIDAFDLKAWFAKPNRSANKSDPKLKVLWPHSWRQPRYRVLTPLFEHAAKLAEFHRGVTREKSIKTLIEFFRPGTLKNSGTMHVDYVTGSRDIDGLPLARRLTGISLMRTSSENARGGEFQYLDPEDARLAVPHPDVENAFIAADTGKIKTMPINAYALFLNPDLMHKGTPAENAYRCRIRTSSVDFFW
jgi:hypothetical protein